MLFQHMTLTMIREREPRYTETKARDMPGTVASYFNSHGILRRKGVVTHRADVNADSRRHSQTFPGSQ